MFLPIAYFDKLLIKFEFKQCKQWPDGGARGMVRGSLNHEDSSSGDNDFEQQFSLNICPVVEISCPECVR